MLRAVVSLRAWWWWWWWLRGPEPVAAEEPEPDHLRWWVTSPNADPNELPPGWFSKRPGSIAADDCARALGRKIGRTLDALIVVARPIAGWMPCRARHHRRQVQ